MYRIELIDEQGECLESRTAKLLDIQATIREWLDSLAVDKSVCITRESEE